MSHKRDWGPNPNVNCLDGMRCQTCGESKAIIMEVVGVVHGTKSPSRFMVVMRDDGFVEPFCDGDTTWPDDQTCICTNCDSSGPAALFRDPPARLAPAAAAAAPEGERP